MKIYPYLSYQSKKNGTDVKYICNLQKVWDSSDSLNGNSCSLLFFIRSTIPMMEKAPLNDFRRTVPSAGIYCCK